MSTTMYRGDDTLLIEVGRTYRLCSSMSGQWVEITSIVDGIVHVRGLDNTIAAWSIPIKRFDDLVESV